MAFSLDLGFRRKLVKFEPGEESIRGNNLPPIQRPEEDDPIEVRNVGGSSDSSDAEPIALPRATVDMSNPQADSSAEVSPPKSGVLVARPSEMHVRAGKGVTWDVKGITLRRRSRRRKWWLIASVALLIFVLFTATWNPVDLPPSLPLNAESPIPLLKAVLALSLLVGIGAVLGILATLSHALRKLKNPLYWQLMSWFLVAIGIILRPFVLGREDWDILRLPTVAVAGVVAIVVLPSLMRWLNRLKPEPGLTHAAVPLSLGVLLDVAQLAAKSYFPKMAMSLGL